MNGHHTGGGDRQERLNELILEYVDALQAGQEIDQRRFVAAHPDFRPELKAFIAEHDEVERMVAPLRGATGEGKGGSLAQRSVPSGGRCIRPSLRSCRRLS